MTQPQAPGAVAEPAMPSEVRARIRAQHEELTRLLTRVEHPARAIGEQGAREGGALRSAILAFEVPFLNHIATEEGQLAPLIREADAWGDVRLEHMQREHAQQRSDLLRLVAGVKALDAEGAGDGLPALAESALRFVAAIREDMAREEEEFLSDDLIHDDVVVRSQSDG